MNYPKSFIEKFITFVEREPILWDSNNELYCNSNAHDACWEYISVQLNELYEGGNATGRSLHWLWSSLLSHRLHYRIDKDRIGYGFVDKMKFLDANTKKEPKVASLEDESAFSFVKHVFANLVFIGLYVIMSVYNVFTGSFQYCNDVTLPLFLAWCIVTGVSAFAAYWTTSKNLKLRKNGLPTLIVALYATICTAAYVVNQPSPTYMTSDYYGRFEEVTTLRGCETHETTFAYAIMGFLGFPIAMTLSHGYHFMKITSHSIYVSSWKAIFAAYCGSAVTLLVFLVIVNWHGAYLLFIAWILVNAKFSADGVNFAWKKQKKIMKERYSVKWNSTTEKFEIILNEKEKPTKLVEVTVIPTKVEMMDKKVGM